MYGDSLICAARRRAYLAGPALTLLRRLAQQDRIRLGVFTSRDGCRACLLGHLASTPPMRGDGWHFVSGIPHWQGHGGVAAAGRYFGLDWPVALDLFGTKTESRAGSLDQRFRIMENMLHCNNSVAARLAG